MTLDQASRESIESILKVHPMVLFMKGTRTQPQCGFSATTINILDMLIAEYATVNVLDDAGLREAIKAYGQWPTIPQLYVKGELIGGCDIVTELFEAGELYGVLGIEPPDNSVPVITFSYLAAAAVKRVLSRETELNLHLSIDARWQAQLDLGPVKSHEIRVYSDGVPVLMDPNTAQRADGLRIDVINTLQGNTFVFDNPNAPQPIQQAKSPDQAH